MNVYAQGDVILVQVDDNIEIKPEKVIVPSGHPVVLAEGEHTGHRHAFYAHGALAMTTPGDTSMATLAEVTRMMKGAGARIER